MHLIVVGLNHKTAPVELREKLSIPEERLPHALAELRSLDTVCECLILSTCNRSEVYAYVNDQAADSAVAAKLAAICGMDSADFASSLYVHRAHKVAEHLFRVASGIDSMVTGEQQILGQVKSAYSTASRENATGPVLNSLFQHAITVGKRARTETDISRGAFSIGSVAVQLAGSIFESLAGRTVLVVGAGKIAELTVTHLSSCGETHLLVTNRTLEKAEPLAREFGGRAVPFEDLALALEHADIVITSTGAPEPIITRDIMLPVMRARRGRPVFFIDIAVPRDIERSVGRIDNVFVYDIDDLEGVVVVGAATRQAEVAKVEALVGEQVEEFMRWFRTLDAVPVIAALRGKYEGICESEMEKLRSRLPHLSDEDWNAISMSARSIVRKLCHEPVIRVKQYTESGDASDKLDVVRELFGLEEGEQGNAE